MWVGWEEGGWGRRGVLCVCVWGGGGGEGAGEFEKLSGKLCTVD